MQICRLKITNFRGIRSADILIPRHAVLIGDNNTGKTTVLEAIDLALGPDRLNRIPPIDEHDFYHGEYAAGPVTQTSAESDAAAPAANEEADLETADADNEADTTPTEAPGSRSK